MTKIDALSPSVTKKAETIHAAIKEVRRLQAKHQVKDIFAIKNGLNTIPILSLPILLKVHIWRKKDGWNRPYKLLAINSKTCTINMPHGPTNF